MKWDRLHVALARWREVKRVEYERGRVSNEMAALLAAEGRERDRQQSIAELVAAAQARAQAEREEAAREHEEERLERLRELVTQHGEDVVAAILRHAGYELPDFSGNKP